MADFIALFFLIISFIGIVILAIKKFSLLLAFPVGEMVSPRAMLERLKNRVQSSKPMRHVASPELFLQTILSKTRVFVLRAETKIAHVLEFLRKKSQEKKNNKFSVEYWKNLRKK